MLTDAAAIAFSLIAMRLAARPAKGAMTYGLKRVEILSAQANGVTLLILAAFISYEAIRRLFDPPAVRGGLILAVALIGVAVNLTATYTLAKANRQSLNVEGSFQHILTDLYAFIGTAIAAGVIIVTGFDRADPIVSLLIAGLMIHSGYGLVKASGRIFLEAAPQGIDPTAIGQALAAQPGVVEIHDLHVWEVTSGFPALSAHVTVNADCDCHATRRAMDTLIHNRFDIEHTTLQVDHQHEHLLTIEPLQPTDRRRFGGQRERQVHRARRSTRVLAVQPGRQTFMCNREIKHEAMGRLVCRAKALVVVLTRAGIEVEPHSGALPGHVAAAAEITTSSSRRAGHRSERWLQHS